LADFLPTQLAPFPPHRRGGNIVMNVELKLKILKI